MVVRVGTTRQERAELIEDGFLPTLEVGSAKEAKALLVSACETNLDGEYVARELAQEQTLPLLAAFAWRLKRAHDERLVPFGRCDCGPTGPTVFHEKETT